MLGLRLYKFAVPQISKYFVPIGKKKGAPILEIWPNGNADTILFYPGTMTCPGHYSLFLYALYLSGFTVVSPHLSGHGMCVKDRNFTFSKLLEQCILTQEWIQSNISGNLAICGHSQGGILALAHAGTAFNITAAFAISAVFPRLEQAISVTRFGALHKHRKKIMDVINVLAKIMPQLPVPLPLYLSLKKIIAGRSEPLFIGAGRSCFSYPLKFIASLFDAKIHAKLNCPFWLFNAKNDVLFQQNLIKHVFEIIDTKCKKLIWLENGGHLVPLNPDISLYIAKTISAACAGLSFNLNLKI